MQSFLYNILVPASQKPWFPVNEHCLWLNKSVFTQTPLPMNRLPLGPEQVHWLKLTWQKGGKKVCVQGQGKFSAKSSSCPILCHKCRNTKAGSEVPRTNGWGWKGWNAPLQGSASWAAPEWLLHVLQDLLCYHCPESEFDRPAAAHSSRHRNNSAHTAQLCCFLTRPQAGPGLAVHCVLQTTSAKLLQGNNHFMIKFNFTLEAQQEQSFLK